MGVLARGVFLVLLLGVGILWGCASTNTDGARANPDLITRDQIMESGATNLYDVVSRLRPRWLQVHSTRSFSMETEIVVFQNDMQLGGPDALKQLGPENAFEIRWLDGARAAATLPGLMSGRHIAGAIIVNTRPHGGG